MIFEGSWKASLAKYCLPPDPLLLRGTHPDLLYLEDAWWRERGFAALKIDINTDYNII